MNSTVNYRERGQSTLTVLLGMALGTFVIGGLMLFYFTANDNSHNNTSRADQEADAVKVLNRAGRDVSDSARVHTAREDAMVVEQKTVDPDNKRQRTTYVRYSLLDEDGDGLGELVRHETTGSAPDFEGDGTVLARNVRVKDVGGAENRKVTKFEYRDKDGELVGEDADAAGLVDITFVAETKSGLVEIRTSASVNTGLGGTAEPAGSAPQAQDIVITVEYGSTASVTPVIEGVEGTRSFTVSPAPGLPSGITVSINPSSGVVTGGASSLYTGDVPSGDIAAGSYTVNGDNGSGTGNIVIRVLPITVSAPAPAFAEQCGPNNDTLTIPNETGVLYRVNGVDAAAGPRTVGASVTVTVRARNGYALSNAGASWTFVDTNEECAAESVSAYPEGAPAGIDTTHGVNVVQWSGGPVTATRIGGPAGAPVVLSGNLASSSGTARIQVPLGTEYRYTVGSLSDTAVQFPAPNDPVAMGTGTDGVRNTTVPSGRNTVRMSNPVNLPSGSLIQLRAYKSQMMTTGIGVAPTPQRTFNIPLAGHPAHGVSGQPALASSCPDMAGSGGCFHDTGRSPGSETVYVAVAYTPAAADVAQNAALAAHAEYVTVNGQQGLYFPSYTKMHVSTNPVAYYSTNRAYQAPSAPTNVTAGNPNGSDCFSAEGTRLVAAHSTAASNGIYHCDTGQAEITYRALGDADGRTSTGAVNNSANVSAAFCDYSDVADANCFTRIVRDGNVIAPKAPASNTENLNPSQGVYQGRWARTENYTLQACNPGGCSGTAATTRLTSFAGKFAIDRFEQRPEDRYKNYNRWYDKCTQGPSCVDPSNRTPARMNVLWENSGGMNAAGGAYYWDLRRVGGLANSPGREAVNQNSGTNSNGNPRTQINGKIDVNPLTLYSFRAKADPITTDKNGLMYRWSTNLNNKALTTIHSGLVPVSFVQDSAFCRTSVDDGWRYGFVLRNRVFDHQKNTRDGLGIKTRFMWWTARLNASTAESEVGRLAAWRWTLGGHNPGTWTKPGNWTNTTGDHNRGTEYYNNNSNNSTDGGYSSNLIGSNTNTIPPIKNNGSGGVAHLRVETYMSRADAGYPDFADMTYWLNDDGSYGSYGYNWQPNTIHGHETRVRAGAASQTMVANCSGNSNGLYYKNAGSTPNANWKAIAEGMATTRRTDRGASGSNSTGITANNGEWNQVY